MRGEDRRPGRVPSSRVPRSRPAGSSGATGTCAGREESAALGSTPLGACARAIRAGSGSGSWGRYEVEVDADGRVRVDGEDVGVLRGVLRGGADDGPAEEGGPGRG
jgi:hypothetical protein